MADQSIVYPDKDNGIAVCWSWNKLMASGGYGGMKGTHVHLVGVDGKTLCGCKTRKNGTIWEFDYWLPEKDWGKFQDADPSMDSVTCNRCVKTNEAHKRTKRG